MNTTFSSLPVEIHLQCLNYLDGTTLKSMRLMSRINRDIAAGALFDVAAPHFTQESVEKLMKLAENESFRCYLHLSIGHEEEEMYEECYEESAPRWWTEVFAGDIILPNLREVTVDTAFTCIGSTCAPFELALTKLLSAADIDILTVKHLQDSCLVGRPDFKQFRTNLRKLHLLLVTYSHDPSPDNDIEIRHHHMLFNVNLNATWLISVQSQLTHLTIHVDTYWGVYPHWQPSDLHFPHLESLALGRWTIAFDWQINFITSHGQTLEKLILGNCPILHALRMTHTQINNQWRQNLGGTSRGKPPTTNIFCQLRWHTVLPEFRMKLTKLKHFAVGRDCTGDYDWHHRAFNDDAAFENRYKLTPHIESSCYAIFDYYVGPSEWIDRDCERGRRWVMKESGVESSNWLKTETDQDVRRKLEYPNC